MDEEKKLEAIEEEYKQIKQVFSDWRMVMDQRNGDSDHDILVRLETVIIGTNGGGLLKRFEKMETALEEFKSEFKEALAGLWTRAEHEKYCADVNARPEIKKRSFQGWSAWVFGCGGIVVAIIAVILK
jgi:hypothetical protein